MDEIELKTEIITLKSINSVQSQKIEDYEQTLYELKRQLSTAKAMEEHLTLEVESLQKSDRYDDEFSKKISILEEEIHNLKQTNSETIQYYENELQAKETRIQNIIENSKIQPDSALQKNRDEIHKYSDEICDLKLKVEELNQQLMECEIKYQEVLLKNNSLDTQIAELIIQLNEMKDCMQCKRDELEESKELTRNLQDELFVMQMEIDKYRSLPLEKAAKGNSIFAEVDDYRVKLQKSMETMKKKYMDMKTQYTNKCQELQKLHMEYGAVIKVIEDKNNFSQEISELKETYDRHFEHLNEKIKSLENELEVQKKVYTKLVAKDWKCVENMLLVAREEVQTLQTKFSAESLGLITSESNHYKTKRELKKWQAEAMLLRAQIISLNQTIDDLKLLKSPPAISQQESNVLIKSCLKKNPVLLTSGIDNWDSLEENSLDYSITPELGNFNEHREFNPVEDMLINPDYLIFDLKATKCDEKNSSDEFRNVRKSEEENKNNISILNEASGSLTSKLIGENASEENKSYSTSSDNLASLISKMNSENTSEIINSTTLSSNDTMEGLTSAMRKVSFEEIITDSSKSNKLGGRKVIRAQPVHIPSIKKN